MLCAALSVAVGAIGVELAVILNGEAFCRIIGGEQGLVVDETVASGPRPGGRLRCGSLHARSMVEYLGEIGVPEGEENGLEMGKGARGGAGRKR